jgi:hypothetical protein
MTDTVKLKQLKIMLDTNVSEEPEALTYSKIYIPSHEPPNNNETPNNNEKNLKMSEYPFFTESIAYPEEILKKKPYKEIVKIFFNKNLFTKYVVNNETASNDPGIIEKNIMIMLDLLFPTNYPVSHNINTSYNKYLLKQPYNIKFDVGKIDNAFQPTEYSYLKLNGYTYTVSEIVFLNDVVNHPQYKKLVESVSEYNEWAKDKSGDIKDEIIEIKNKFAENMKENTTDSLHFNEEDKYIIKKQKKIFTKDDFDNEIRKIFDYFTNSDEKIISKIIKNLNTIDRRTGSSVSKDYFNDAIKTNLTRINFKNVEDMKNNKIESIMKKIYTSGSSDNSLVDDANLNRYLVNFLYASFNKYINSKELIDRSRSFSDMQSFDSNIDKLLSKIEDLNKMNIAKLDNNKVDSITDIIGDINELFEKIKSSSSEFKNITTKITQLSKVSKELKALLLVQKYLLSDTNGIMINYDKDIKNTDAKNIFSEEIKKSQYKAYNKLVNRYKTTILDEQYKSMNIELQKLIDDYFNYKNSKFKTELVDSVDTMNEKKTKFGDLWNVSASSYVSKEGDTSEPDSIYKKVEIYVYMELISGELNDSNLSNVSCEFANDKLIETFNQLTSKGKNYKIIKNKNVFKLPQQTSSEEPNEPANNENDNPIQETTGGKKSRRRIRKNKKTRKINRRLKYSFV